MLRYVRYPALYEENAFTFLKALCGATGSRFSSTAAEEHRKDMIGPPDKISNLRPIKYHTCENESIVDMEFRLERMKVQQWNENFWVKHNTAFIEEMETFRRQKLASSSDTKSLTAAEMSEFYKAFLDKNWKTHVSYNFEWYRKNFYLLLLALKVKLKSTR